MRPKAILCEHTFSLRILQTDSSPVSIRNRQLLTSIFALLFWDILWDEDVPGAFEYCYQDGPLDLYEPGVFLRSRERQICELLKDIGLDPATLYPEIVPRPPPLNADDARYSAHTRKATDATVVEGADPFVNEELEDLRDACMPTNDELKRVKAWWLLECIPAKARIQNEKDEWVKKYK